MAFLKTLGLALVAAFVTVVAMIGGFVFSIVSAIVSTILFIAGIFAVVFLFLGGSAPDESDTKRRND